MFNKLLKLNIKSLSNAVTSHDLELKKQKTILLKQRLEIDGLIKNQELLFKLNKKLADCFQLEWDDGVFRSKKNKMVTK